MYTKEELFKKNMLDFMHQTIPSRYGIKGVANTPEVSMPDYVHPYDPFDPHIIKDLKDWIKGPGVIRTEVALEDDPAQITQNNCSITNIVRNGDYLDIDVEITGNLYATIEFPGVKFDNYGDAFWLEFINTASDPRVITVVTGGNYNMDISGGITRRFGEPQYDNAVDVQCDLPQIYFDSIFWDVNYLHLGFRGGIAGDTVKIRNLALWKVQPA